MRKVCLLAVSLFGLVPALVIVAFGQQRGAGQPVPTRQSIPRTADGKPDFTGVWAGPGFTHKVGPGDTDNASVTPYQPEKMSPFKPGGEAFMNRRATGNAITDDPTAACLPNGLTRQILSPYAQQWIQTPAQMIVLYEYMHFFRVIPTDGRAHARDVELTWMGDSVGKWEGDTLVIDTIGLKEWMFDATHDFNPGQLRIHSDQLHLIERLKYIDPTTVSYQVTIDDPKIFTAPWSQDFQMKFHPTWKILEFVCEENNRCMFGKCNESDAQKTAKE
jgi:hypothetical protein